MYPHASGYGYADDTLHRALRLKFQAPKEAQLAEVRQTLQTIADRIGAEVHELLLPELGFLSRALDKHQRSVLSDALTLPYANDNVAQQQTLKDMVKIEESKERMVPLKPLMDEYGYAATFSKSPIHEACGQFAGQQRVMHLRREVAHKACLVAHGLNAAGLQPHFEDCWRHKDVQEGLFLRRLALVARQFWDRKYDWRKVKTVSSSFTAPAPGLAGHMAGAAIDIRIRDLDKKKEFLPLGNDYAEGGASSSLRFPYLTFEEWRTRTLVAQTMRMAGFKLLDTEDWHGSHGDRGLSTGGNVKMRTAIYGPLDDFDRETGEVRPLERIKVENPFTTDREIEDIVDIALERNGGGNNWKNSVLEVVQHFREMRSRESISIT